MRQLLFTSDTIEILCLVYSNFFNIDTKDIEIDCQLINKH